jgi:hypothetical protein
LVRRIQTAAFIAPLSHLPYKRRRFDRRRAQANFNAATGRMIDHALEGQ